MGGIVFLNDKLLPSKEAKLPAIRPGFLYGFGLFETMRSYKGSIVYFRQHLERIRKSCAALKIHFPYPLSRLRGYIEEVVRINGFKDARIRLTLWKNHDKATDTLIFSKRYIPPCAEKYREGFHCLLSATRISEGYFFARFKTTSYLLYNLAYSQAQQKGFDEAIILNGQGCLAEGSISNIFFVKDNQLFTPGLECACLEGITRKAVFDLAKDSGIKIREGKFTLPDLLSCDEAFLTNSLMGIMPLGWIGNHRAGKRPFKLTRFLMESYRAILNDGNKKD